LPWQGRIAQQWQHMPGLRSAFCLPLACLALTLAACPRHGVVDDGTSISYGPSNRGKLMRPARLPGHGEGYWTPPRWAQRGLRYGTDELVALLVHVGRRLDHDRPGTRMGVADLSPLRGGPSAWHHSHQTGRDADLLFFATDASGKPVELTSMPIFDAGGMASLPTGVPDDPGTPQDEAVQALRFDAARNWLLVRALLENQIAPVQYVFIADALRQLLLDHARLAGEPEALVQQAGFLLQQPGDALPHDDHMHVRILCAASDRVHGCNDRGALHWAKKGYKYDPIARLTSTIAQNALAQVAPTPMPAMLVLGAFPFRPEPPRRAARAGTSRSGGCAGEREQRVEHGRLLRRIEVLGAGHAADLGAQALAPRALVLAPVGRERIIVREQHVNALRRRAHAAEVHGRLDPRPNAVPRPVDAPPAGHAQHPGHARVLGRALEKAQDRLAAHAVAEEVRAAQAAGIEPVRRLLQALDPGRDRGLGRLRDRRQQDLAEAGAHRGLRAQPGIEVGVRVAAPARHDAQARDVGGVHGHATSASARCS
jgi:penicillin-insensitive murein endopeptidase